MKTFKLSRFTPLLVGMLVSIASTSYAQYSAVFQSAKSIGKGNGEFSLLYSNIGYANDGLSEKILDNLGLLAGFGVTDLTEIRVRYDRLGYFSEGMELGLNTLMVGPKFSEESDLFAIYLPVGFAFSEGNGNSWMANPAFLFSISLGEKVLLNINPNYAFSLEKGNNFEDGLLGIPLGLAINLGESWILRPEGGITFEMGYSGKYYNFGLGISRKLGINE